MLIVILKIVKAVTLLAVAIGAIGLIHVNVGESLYRWIRELNLIPSSACIHCPLKQNR